MLLLSNSGASTSRNFPVQPCDNFLYHASMPCARRASHTVSMWGERRGPMTLLAWTGRASTRQGQHGNACMRHPNRL